MIGKAIKFTILRDLILQNQQSRTSGDTSEQTKKLSLINDDIYCQKPSKY
jgi:hypothetical protein